MPEPNKWIDASIKLATSNGYLDNLLNVYPLTPNKERELPKDAEEQIKKLVAEKDKSKLIVYLLGFEKFPIATSYTSSLREDYSLIEKNPKTIAEMHKMLLDIGIDKIIKGAKEPKIVSKQAGAMFLRWLSNQYQIVSLTDFEKSSKGNVILAGSDKTRKAYANSKLNAELDEKGIDLLLKKDNKFVMGQAKFITAGVAVKITNSLKPYGLLMEQKVMQKE